MAAIFSRWKWVGVLVLALVFVQGRAFPAAEGHGHGPRLVMIIRHAEKPEEVEKDKEKDPNLSKRGYERAEALAKVIPEHFPRPDFLIATKKSKSSDRPVETLTPLGKALHEKVEAEFSDDEFAEVAHAVLTDPKYEGKVVLIAWHHGKIPDLAKAFGVKDVPEAWDPKVFDRVWEISFEGKAATLKDVPQRALAGDSEK